MPGYIRRRRRIEDLEARLIQKLAAAEAPAAAASSAEVVAQLALLNDLIAPHNRYYPIEANLPIDVRSRPARPRRPLSLTLPAERGEGIRGAARR